MKYMDCIYVSQDTGQCRALVGMVINFRFRQIRGISVVAQRLLVSQEGLSSM
jgi:hypothetical protein